jgi:hypothetical protein
MSAWAAASRSFASTFAPVSSTRCTSRSGRRFWAPASALREHRPHRVRLPRCTAAAPGFSGTRGNLAILLCCRDRGLAGGVWLLGARHATSPDGAGRVHSQDTKGHAKHYRAENTGKRRRNSLGTGAAPSCARWDRRSSQPLQEHGRRESLVKSQSGKAIRESDRGKSCKGAREKVGSEVSPRNPEGMPASRRRRRGALSHPPRRRPDAQRPRRPGARPRRRLEPPDG